MAPSVRATSSRGSGSAGDSVARPPDLQRFPQDGQRLRRFPDLIRQVAELVIARGQQLPGPCIRLPFQQLFHVPIECGGLLEQPGPQILELLVLQQHVLTDAGVESADCLPGQLEPLLDLDLFRGQLDVFDLQRGVGRLRLDQPPRRADEARDQGEQHQAGGHHRAAVLPHEFPEPIGPGGRRGQHRFGRQVPQDVGRQAVGRLVATDSVLLQRLHHDPVEVARQRPLQLRRLDAAAGRDVRQPHGGADLRARPRGIDLPHHAEHLQQAHL